MFGIGEDVLASDEKMSMESSLEIVESMIEKIGSSDITILFFTKDGHQTIHYDATTRTLSEALPEKGTVLYVIPKEPKPIKVVIKE